MLIARMSTCTASIGEGLCTHTHTACCLGVCDTTTTAVQLCIHTRSGCRFGFNAHATYLHGLWAGQASANSDFAAIAWQFRLLGFNAIRLPFLFADLWTPAEMIGGAALHTQQHALPVAATIALHSRNQFSALSAPSSYLKGHVYVCVAAPGYCTHQSTLQELAQRTVDPEYRGTISKAPPTPPVALPDVSKAGSCNTYIPPTPGNKGLAIDRYLWTVQWFIANGFYVMVDW